MQIPKIEERRLYERLGAKGEVLLRAANDGDILSKASLDDLSFNGFRIRSKKRFELDEEVRFELDADFLEAPFKGTGRIRHVEDAPFGSSLAGAEFTNADPDSCRELIKGALRARTKERSRREKLARELGLTLKIAPFILLISLGALIVSNAVASSLSAENEYNGKLREATIHYLYNPH